MTGSKKQTLNRAIIYTAGMIILAMGITLNTKTLLGVSPLISMPYSVSQITGLNFATLCFIMYALFVFIEIWLEGDRRTKIDWLQIPYSMAFSIVLQLCDDAYEGFMAALGLSIESFPARLALLVVAIAMVGIGVSMSVSMKLIPNPADGLAREVGIKLKKGLGLGKNAIDITAVAITCIIGLVSVHHIVGVGLGTVAAMIGVGRAVAAFNYFALEPMKRAAGLNEE